MRYPAFVVWLTLLVNSNIYSQSKQDLTNAYSKAIAEYIKAVYKRDNLRFDTLFVGKNKDVPDIKLSPRIENTPVLLLTQEDANKKRTYRKSLVFVNIAGAVTKENAEFVFFTFFPKYEHQFDCMINLIYKPDKKTLQLNTLTFKNYAYK